MRKIDDPASTVCDYRALMPTTRRNRQLVVKAVRRDLLIVLNRTNQPALAPVRDPTRLSGALCSASRRPASTCRGYRLVCVAKYTVELLREMRRYPEALELDPCFTAETSSRGNVLIELERWT